MKKNIKHFNFISLVLLLFILTACFGLNAQKTEVKLDYLNNKSVTYDEAIEHYKSLDSQFGEAKLFEYGLTDVGRPLHLFVISSDKDFDPVSIRKSNKRIVLINNGIHPGEPCGIDGAIQFANDILFKKNDLDKLLEHTVICIIPVYNIGGALKRSDIYRLDQNGPEEFGYRGNRRNLDLNRDFIKNDSENAKSFTKIFQHWRPDCFLDTHTTNGSDHQNPITLIIQNSYSMQPILGQYSRDKMVPDLFKRMDKTEFKMIPYVTFKGREIEDGIMNNVEGPRFSTGYTNLFNCFSYMTENLIYSPFKDRVLSVYNFMIALTSLTNDNYDEIGKLIAQANEAVKKQEEFPIKWKLDETRFDEIEFHGFKRNAEQISPYTGRKRTTYNHDEPITFKLKNYYHQIVTETIKKPKKYIIPQAWSEVIERLKMNNVEMTRLDKDEIIEAEVYKLADYLPIPRENTPIAPYSGHYLYTNVNTTSEILKVQFFKGDYVVEVNQDCNTYIINVLEPKTLDSFFKWNFFDSILSDTEWATASSWYFEEEAVKLLKENLELKQKLEAKIKADTEFAKDKMAHLNFIWENSKHMDRTKDWYPVVRIN